jgi:hypothetical protein
MDGDPRMPGDSTRVRNKDEYVAAWNDYVAPIRRVFQVEIAAFDPGIVVECEGERTIVSKTFTRRLRLVAVALEKARDRMQAPLPRDPALADDGSEDAGWKKP